VISGRVRALILALPALAVVMSIACEKKTPVENRDSKQPASRASSADPGSNSEKIGVPECDDFVAKYEACISAHVPEAQRTQYKENIDGYRRAWRQQIAANPEVKSALPAACKRHLEQARITMKQFGCEF
jgi:hypothetical protein